MPSSGEVTDCNLLNIPPVLLPFQVCKALKNAKNTKGQCLVCPFRATVETCAKSAKLSLTITQQGLALFAPATAIVDKVLLHPLTDIKVKRERQMQLTYPTIGPPRSKLYTCLGFSRYLNFLSTLEEEKQTEESNSNSIQI